jgi:hypothetical protein
MKYATSHENDQIRMKILTEQLVKMTSQYWQAKVDMEFWKFKANSNKGKRK